MNINVAYVLRTLPKDLYLESSLKPFNCQRDRYTTCLMHVDMLVTSIAGHRASPANATTNCVEPPPSTSFERPLQYRWSMGPWYVLHCVFWFVDQWTIVFVFRGRRLVQYNPEIRLQMASSPAVHPWSVSSLQWHVPSAVADKEDSTWLACTLEDL